MGIWTWSLSTLHNGLWGDLTMFNGFVCICRGIFHNSRDLDL